jgi:hypothetical protein
MGHLKTGTACLLALALHSTAWAEIYESTDAEGNPEFSDSPMAPDSQEVQLQQTNIIEAPQPEPEAPDPAQGEPQMMQQEPTQENNTVIVNDGVDNDAPYEDYRVRERAFNRVDGDEPREVLDAATPYEVGDSNSQMPREVGDSDAQMPREVGDSDEQMPREVGDYNNQMPREVGDSDAQMPREVGDFPAGGENLHRR